MPSSRSACTRLLVCLVVFVHGHSSSLAFHPSVADVTILQASPTSSPRRFCPLETSEPSWRSHKRPQACILRGHFPRQLSLRGTAKEGDMIDQADLSELKRQGFEAAMVGQFQAAADLLEEYLSRVETEDVSALNCRGAMLAELNEWDTAETCLRSAVEVASATSEEQALINAHFNLGNILIKQGKHADAVASFRAVLELRKDDLQALNNLGLALSDQGQKEDALEAFTAAVALDPDDPIALTNQANVLADLGRHVDAVLCYEDAADAGAETDLDYWLNLGVAARRAGMKAVAEEALQSVLELDPKHVLARRLLGTVKGSEDAGDDAGAEGMSAEEEAAYAAELFDGYAEDFERELVDELQYEVPGQLVGLLLKAGGVGAGTRGAWRTVVDAGCGSGLVGDYARSYCARLVGVDASQGMVAQARERESDGERIYDEVEQDELGGYLDAMEGGADVVIAADVFCYISDLRPALEAAAGALRRCDGGAGLMAFSTEDPEQRRESRGGEGGAEKSKGWILKSSGRYGHEAGWVRRAVEAAGMEVAREEEGVLRLNGDEAIRGRLWVARLR